MQINLEEARAVQGLTVRLSVVAHGPDEIFRFQQLCSEHRQVKRFVPAGLTRAWHYARDSGDLRGSNALALEGILPDANPYVFSQDQGSPSRFFLTLQVRETDIARLALAQLSAAASLDDLFDSLDHLAIEGPPAPFVSSLSPLRSNAVRAV